MTDDAHSLNRSVDEVRAREVAEQKRERPSEVVQFLKPWQHATSKAGKNRGNVVVRKGSSGPFKMWEGKQT